MRAVYLRSVGGDSPLAVPGRFKLNYEAQNMDVFSQVPRQDDTYAEDEDDSFVVCSDEEVEGKRGKGKSHDKGIDSNIMYSVHTSLMVVFSPVMCL